MYLHPFAKLEGAKVSLYALKMLKFFKLLTGSDFPCVAPDSVFNIMQAHRWHFEKNEGNGEEAENDPVRLAFPSKETCTVLICSST